MKWIFKDGRLVQIIENEPLLLTIDQNGKLEDLRFNFILPSLLKLQSAKTGLNNSELDKMEDDLKAAYSKLCKMLKVDNLLFN